MGEIVLAAKVTHVPSIWLSETQEQFQGIRQNAIDGLTELGRRARARKVDTFVIIGRNNRNSKSKDVNHGNA